MNVSRRSTGETGNQKNRLGGIRRKGEKYVTTGQRHSRRKCFDVFLCYVRAPPALVLKANKNNTERRKTNGRNL